MRSKFKCVGIFIFLISLMFYSVSVQAIELDVNVEDALQEFISGYRLSQFEINQLSDPFQDFRPPEPEGGEDFEPEEVEVIEPPSFKVNGLVSRGEDMAAIIESGNTVEVLRPGQSLDGYVFSHKINNRLIFTKEGEQFELFAREGETR